MSNNPKLQDMGEHAKQLLDLIEECKPDANLELLAGKLKQWKIELNKIQTDDIVTKHGYIIHSDNTVTDPKTGLMWKHEYEPGRSSYKPEPDGYKAYNLDEFISKKNIYSVYDDWRLPTIDELKTLVLHDGSYENGFIDCKAFPKSVNNFWSSSKNKDGRELYVSFSGGHESYNLDQHMYIRLVRSTK